MVVDLKYLSQQVSSYEGGRAGLNSTHCLIFQLLMKKLALLDTDWGLELLFPSSVMWLSACSVYTSSAHKKTFVVHRRMKANCGSWRGVVRNSPPLALVGLVEHPGLQVYCIIAGSITLPSCVTSRMTQVTAFLPAKPLCLAQLLVIAIEHKTQFKRLQWWTVSPRPPASCSKD